MCNIASNKQVETSKFYNVNKNSIIEFTKRYNKNKVTLFCRKCDRNCACQNEYKSKPDELLPLIVTDDTFTWKKKSERHSVLCIQVLLINEPTIIFKTFH